MTTSSGDQVPGRLLTDHGRGHGVALPAWLLIRLDGGHRHRLRAARGYLTRRGDGSASRLEPVLGEGERAGEYLFHWRSESAPTATASCWSRRRRGDRVVLGDDHFGVSPDIPDHRQSLSAIAASGPRMGPDPRVAPMWGCLRGRDRDPRRDPGGEPRRDAASWAPPSRPAWVAAGNSRIGDVRGLGLMLASEFVTPDGRSPARPSVPNRSRASAACSSLAGPVATWCG